MKVLVTGASGLLGRAVAAATLAAGHEVRTFQRRPSGVPGASDVLGSVTDSGALERAVEGMDAVIHLAAKVSLAGDPAEFDTVNVGGTRALIAALTQGAPAVTSTAASTASREAVSTGPGTASTDAAARRLVYVSSPSVAHSGASISGEPAMPADPARARGDYARTKAHAELLALAADSPRLQVVAVRPHLVWGPGDTQLVARVVERARSGRLPLLGHGAALIDTTYIDNAASGIVAALERADDVHGRAYVITNGEPRPVAELLAGICAAAGVRAPGWRVSAGLARTAGSVIEAAWRIRAGSDEPPMTRFLAEQLSTAHWFDQRQTRADLHWVPAVSLDEGFRRLAASYAR
ncbi:NAD-dependent epimerase/dehydratase family protein [Glaciibacter psychrotolerans]|uniref:Nucleoside-diphosphate-sugar epimerase n=1 Tax=Glaciibacter psychrotolerans TaxID=670054 RepID=A0A7Z0EG07_9MICO|nr:NAD-dependent epimerase/dehydratase family protein [Leifsonia psychrotolerans]NYJ20850.1 nucleoside-diphosphate-sugar epimerase [Leifsonia psychrotolerans]